MYLSCISLIKCYINYKYECKTHVVGYFNLTAYYKYVLWLIFCYETSLFIHTHNQFDQLLYTYWNKIKLMKLIFI